MKSLRIIKVDTCQECPYCLINEMSCNLDYYCDYYCKKTYKNLNEFLYPKDENTIDAKRDFPKWCPLEVYFER
jgi:hypothetical protein